MMSTNSPILTVNQPCDAAVNFVSEKLKNAGFSVLQTFDLQQAKQDQAACACQVHGSDPCSCQAVVLLVYPAAGSPLTLIGYGDEKATVFSLVDTPQQKPDPHLEAVIYDCLASYEALVDH